MFFFFSSRRRHTRSKRDWSSDVCSSDLSPWHPLRASPQDNSPSSSSSCPGKIETGDQLYAQRRHHCRPSQRRLHHQSPPWRSEERRVGKETKQRGREDHDYTQKDKMERH